jgi:flavodoxin
MKVLVIYDSKYGNTKIVAENILEGLKQVEDIEGKIVMLRKLTLKTLAVAMC